MTTAEPLTPSAPRRGLGPVWAMMIVFGLPFLASVLYYFNPDWLPSSKTHRGALLNPPVATDTWPLYSIEGRSLSLEGYRGEWLLVMVTDAACGSACEERVYELRQIRRATGVERARVSRLLLFSAPPAAEVLVALKEKNPQLAFASSPAQGALVGPTLTPGSVLIVDPMGNAMMHYTPDAPAKDLLKDLKHLLKLSQDWRTSGQ